MDSPQTTSYLGLGITHSSMSLSQKLKQASEKSQKHIQRSTTLPTLQGHTSRNLSQEVHAMYLSPSKVKSTATRLSGLSESVNTSALFAEKVSMPTKPLTICIRCSSTHAALCMTCVEQDCQNALTFYRKTRAAGAATLFSKAFIEAGYTKLLKFVIFRLLKNGFESRRRQHLKKKTVVEKLFGTNLVCIPFSAWKRYTKENIMNRKNKTIQELSERVKILESQVQKLSSTVQENNFQIDFLKAEVVKRDTIVNDQKNEIIELKQLLKSDRNRVKSLVQMVTPLIHYSETVDKIIHQKIVETSRYISHAALAATHNYSQIIHMDVFDDLNTQEGSSISMKILPKAAALPKTSLIATDVALKWISMTSQLADDQLPPPGGRKLSHYLPPHQAIESLFDLRNGKHLVRAVVTIILERQKISRQQDVGSLQSFTVKYTKLWPQKGLDVEDLEHIKAIQMKGQELLAFTLQLAHQALDLPLRNPNEVISGKGDAIFQMIVELMNAALPRLNQRDRNAIEQRINRYYELNNELEQIQQNRPDLTALNSLNTFLYKEFKKRQEESEEDTLSQSNTEPEQVLDNQNPIVMGQANEIDYRLLASMNDRQYLNMCSVVDETISNSQYLKVADLSLKTISINEKLLDLQSLIAQGRDQRDIEIRLTTEVRQLLFSQYMNHNFVPPPAPMNFNLASLKVDSSSGVIHQVKLDTE